MSEYRWCRTAAGYICTSDEVKQQQRAGVKEVVAVMAVVREDAGNLAPATRRLTADLVEVVEYPNWEKGVFRDVFQPS